MKKLCLFAVGLLFVFGPLSAQQRVVEPTWESINQRGYPKWFADAKLGIFVHWGLYSVPAYAGKEGYGEWFYRGLMTGDADRRRIMSFYADTTQPLFDQYAALADYWHGELWNPGDWARLFRESGARYVMLVTKHHDGYCLWDSPLQPTWNSTMSGPHRNIVEELTAAVRKEGMRMGFYYSLPEWTNPRHIWMESPDDSIADYVENHIIPQFKELVSLYRPDAVFSDGDWQNTAEQFHAEELISWYYNTVGPDAVVNDRWGRGTQHGFLTPEYSAGISVNGRPWAECRGIGRSFGFNRNEDLDNFMTDRELIQHFCELVADGGGLTLNVGPMADGTIPFIQQERLHSLGKWLAINGEAIYGSHPYYDYDCRGNFITNHTQYFRTTALLPTSTAIDFDWVRNAPRKDMPVDNYEIYWKGNITIPEEGDYMFRLVADDEAWVRLVTPESVVSQMLSEGKEIIPAPDTILYFNKGWAKNDKGVKTMHFKKDDNFELEIFYHEKDFESSISLQWSRDGGKTFTPVPAEWNGTAEWRGTIRCFTQQENAVYMIEFERPGRMLTVGGLPDLPKNTTMQLLGTSSLLKWKQRKDGSVDIDFSGVDTREMNALDHAWVIKIK